MYKTCNIVMLPTNEKARFNFYQICIDTEGYYKDKLVTIHNPNLKRVKPQHLYITSDDEIKNDDWCYNSISNELEKWSSKGWIETPDFEYLGYQKIIATTDALPIYKAGIEVGLFVPQIHQQFIQYYIEEYNRSNIITKVDVEYWCGEKNCNCTTRQQDCFRAKQNQIIKINPDNTINIKQIKDSWNRTEVVELLIKAMIYANQYHSDELGEDHVSDWIEENL